MSSHNLRGPVYFGCDGTVLVNDNFCLIQVNTKPAFLEGYFTEIEFANMFRHL